MRRRDRFAPAPAFAATVISTRVERVSFVNVPSFTLHAALPVRLGAREVSADVAFGGAFYAIVDAESAGLPVRPEHLPISAARAWPSSMLSRRLCRWSHPEEPGLNGIYGTIFTGPPSSETAHLRNVTIFAEAEVDRSPCGTGTCAVMAVLAAMGSAGAGAAVRPRKHHRHVISRPRGRRDDSR